MNTPDWSADTAAMALLALIETDRARQCSLVLGGAHERANALRTQAQTQARQLMREAFTEQRQQHRVRLHAAQAALATQRRLHAQQRVAALLRLAWERLPGVLLVLWQQAPTRAAWVARTLHVAQARLPHGAWRVAHASDWPETEAQALAGELHRRVGAMPQLVADTSIVAGLKLSTSGSVIDGSLAGLLASSSEIEARLARLLEPA